MTTTDPAIRTDKHGFPIEQCGRCGGRGNMSEYANVFGGQCFKCRGTGWIHPAGTAGKLAAEWLAIFAAARRVDTAAYWDPTTRTITCALAAGETIARDGQWHLVTGVQVTRRILGEAYFGLSPDGTPTLTRLTLEVWITYADGSRRRGGSLVRRKIDAPALTAVRDELAARAKAAYARTLAARARRSARPSTARIDARVAEVARREAAIDERFPGLAGAEYPSAAYNLRQTAATEDALWRADADAGWVDYLEINGAV